MRDLDTFLNRAANHGQRSIVSYSVTIATTAASADDEVFVTFDSDNGPKERQVVQWRPRISDSGSLVRVYPSRGMTGVLIPTDIGRPWLLW